MNVDRLREALEACRTSRERIPFALTDSPLGPWMLLIEALAELTLKGAQQDITAVCTVCGEVQPKHVVGCPRAEIIDSAARAMLGLPTFPEHQTEVYKPGVLRTEFNGDVSERIIPVEAWADRTDEHTAAIEAAFPTSSGSHDEYAIAVQMVGHRHSKRELVALVNWLLVERKAAQATAGRLLSEDTAVRRALNASPHETTLQAAERVAAQAEEPAEGLDVRVWCWHSQ